MKIYLAARYSRRLELCAYREELQVVGHQVTSRWLNGGHDTDDKGRARPSAAALEGGEVVATAFASEDLEDIDQADMVIAFTEQPGQGGRNRGGRHVELGYALGLDRWGAGMRIWIVGPRENVFCWEESIEQFDTWTEALVELVARTQADGDLDDLSDVGGEG